MQANSPIYRGWVCGLSLALSLGQSGAASAADWPQFRGPLGAGIAPPASLPLQWSPASNVDWQISIPGSGWSQPVVVGKKIFLTAAVSSIESRPKIYADGLSDLHTVSGHEVPAPEIQITWSVWSIDLESGRVRWAQPIASGIPKYAIHPSNTYASETPAADDDGVYVWLGSAGLVASLDHEGHLRWKKELGPFRQLENYGTGSSLRLHSGLIYLQCFSEDEAFLLCLQAADGKERWRVVRPKPGSCWSSPLVWQSPQNLSLVVLGQNLMTAHDLLTGAEHWRFEGTAMPSMTSACTDAEHLYFGCRDPFKGGPLRALTAPRRDSPSSTVEGKMMATEAWTAPGAAPGMPSPLAAGGCVFVLNSTFLGCYDAATGREHFKERLPGFRSIIASPIAIGSTLLIIDEDGTALTLAAEPAFRILGCSKLNDIFWASPAVAGNALLLRGVNYLYCIRQPSP